MALITFAQPANSHIRKNLSNGYIRKILCQIRARLVLRIAHMNTINTPNVLFRTAIVTAIVAYGSLSIFCYAGTDSSIPDKTTDTTVDKSATTTPADAKPVKLTGAELYQINCNRCHPERYPAEWNSAQWQTIMIHMRVRANLPASQAREILKYLKEDSGS